MPEVTLLLEDLYLGKTDAKNELLTYTPEEKERFSQSFVIPENLRPNSFLKGDYYYVTGLKGTGKTALLRYLAINAEQQSNVRTSFILFKSDFSDDDRKDISKAAGASTVLADKDTSEYEGTDYEVVWRWFLHRQIAETLGKHNNVFQTDYHWDKYVQCVTAPQLGKEEFGIKKLLPKLRKGNVEISGNPKLGLDFDWEDAEKTMVKFGNIAKQADVLFEELTPATGKFYLLVDELELSLGNQKQYRRDMLMIRDLIIAIDKLNRISRKKRYGIFIIAAVRSEVIAAIGAVGKETNKLTSDFGLPVTWSITSKQSLDHPLIKIVLQRLIASENSIPNNPPFEQTKDHLQQLWNKYFPTTLSRKPSDRYLLSTTWYRPRDIIRRLLICQRFSPKSFQFNEQVFTADCS